MFEKKATVVAVSVSTIARKTASHKKAKVVGIVSLDTALPR